MEVSSYYLKYQQRSALCMPNYPSPSRDVRVQPTAAVRMYHTSTLPECRCIAVAALPGRSRGLLGYHTHSLAQDTRRARSMLPNSGAAHACIGMPALPLPVPVAVALPLPLALACRHCERPPLPCLRIDNCHK